MPKKSLIIYISLGGNTEKVALRFKKVFEKLNWQCDMLKVTRDTDVHNPPYRLDDYDFICVGSLIANGLPLKEIFDDHLGIMMPANLIRGRKPRQGEFGKITDPYGPKKGVAFVTYGGTRTGPPEAIPSLDMLELRMQEMRVKCVGKFSCAGGHKGGHSHVVDTIADTKGWTIEDASVALLRYMKDPNRPEFANFTEEDRKLFEEAIVGRRKEVQAPPSPRDSTWHWDISNRPSERDLLKAEIFMEEILEDYYGGGIDAAPLAQYLCIA